MSIFENLPTFATFYFCFLPGLLRNKEYKYPYMLLPYMVTKNINIKICFVQKLGRVFSYKQKTEKIIK